MAAGCHIVTARQQSSKRWLKSEGGEHVAGEVLPRRTLRLTTIEIDDLCTACHPDDHQLSVPIGDRRVPAERDVVEFVAILGLALRRHCVPSEHEQPLRLGDRQRAPEHCVDQTEGGRRRADGETEREHGSRRRRAVLFQLPRREDHVGEQRLQPRPATLIAQRIHRLRRAADV